MLTSSGFAKRLRRTRFTFDLAWLRHAKPERRSAWCPWPESNQHSLRNSILSRARLPIPPQGLIGHRPEGEVAKPAEYSGRALPVNPRASIRPNPQIPIVRTPGLHVCQQGRMQPTAGNERCCRVIGEAKHSSVIALRLDSVARAG